ncbi:MAG: MBL fold metallo-hydrolase [Nanoarchaeota archaeon]
MKFTFYGGAEEVGRSCIEVDERILLDAGLKITEEGSEYPVMEDCSHIKGVFLGHAHLDHCGALPLFNKRGLDCGIYCNAMTKQTAKILMKDSYQIELINKQHPIYTKDNLMSIISFMENVKYDKTYRLDDIKFSFHYGGHIPGASAIVLEINNKRILYTGDFNTIDTNLLRGAKMKFNNIHTMICEATYGDRPHPGRKAEEKRFLKSIRRVIERGGNVLIPTFAVGRAQEIMEMLNKENFGVPIYLDGMAKRVTNLYRRLPEYINDPGKLNDAVSKVNFIKKWRERKEIVKQQSIIITTSGMLDGGPVIDYLGYFYHDEKNGVFLTGYQGEGSNGRLLLDEGRVFIDGVRVKMKAKVEKFDFSAHAGKKELIETISKTAPKNLILQHGDLEPLEELRAEFEGRMNVFVPKLGENLYVD